MWYSNLWRCSHSSAFSVYTYNVLVLIPASKTYDGKKLHVTKCLYDKWIIKSKLLIFWHNPTNNYTLVSCRLHFHLGTFQWVVIPFPGVPNYTLGEHIRLPIEVQAVQIGGVAGSIPPSARESYGTVGVGLVVVKILGGKGMTVVSNQRIACNK